LTANSQVAGRALSSRQQCCGDDGPRGMPVRGSWHTGPALRGWAHTHPTVGARPFGAHGRSGLVAHGPRSTGLGAHAPHRGRAAVRGARPFGACGTRAPLYGCSTGLGAHAPHRGRTAVRGLWHTGPALRGLGHTHPIRNARSRARQRQPIQKFGPNVAFTAFTSAGRGPVCVEICRFGIGRSGVRTFPGGGKLGRPARSSGRPHFPSRSVAQGRRSEHRTRQKPVAARLTRICGVWKLL
jgi:hypothetical protein